MGQWKRQLSFLTGCKATYSISCVSSNTVCVEGGGLFQGNCSSLNSHPYTEKKDFPPPLALGVEAKCFYWLPGALSDARQVMSLRRYSNRLHPWLAPLNHLLCECMCLWGGWCNSAGSASCCAITKSLLCFCHSRTHTTPCFHIIKRDRSDVWLHFLNVMSFVCLIRSTSKYEYNRNIIMDTHFVLLIWL